jgi:outer membrane protein assembly factor BamB
MRSFAFLCPTRQACLVGLTLLSLSAAPRAEEFVDPAPPEFAAAPADTTEAEPRTFPGLVFHAPPKPLPDEARVSEWPRFLGPTDDAKSPESHLLERFPEGGPAKVWEMEKGNSYTTPVAVGGRLVVFNRFGDEEVVQSLEPETGREHWQFRYPVEYRDRYGFNNGPRASAVVADGRVFTLGVASALTCLDLASGTKLWQRQLAEEFDRLPYFFGHGCAPVVHGDKVIVPLGTADGLAVAAFDVATGRLVWGTRHEWQAGYASPLVATLRGRPRLLVFAGDDSDPPAGGLLCIDPEIGALHDAFPWRPEKYESVNGSSPIVLDGDRVFVSASYDKGGVMLRLGEDLKWEEVWRNPSFGMHWMTPLSLGGAIYGYHGRNEPDASLKAVSAETGDELWDADPEWAIPGPGGRDYRMKYFRGSLLEADGRVWALGEFGSLGILRLTPKGPEEIDRTQLFVARATWSLPVLHRGLLYIAQHEPDMQGNAPRLICYDLRR